MERSVAIEIASHLKAFDGPMNAAMEAVEKIQDPEERRVFRRVLASLVGTIYTELFVPIGKQFPDLLPDKEDMDSTS